VLLLAGSYREYEQQLASAAKKTNNAKIYKSISVIRDGCHLPHLAATQKTTNRSVDAPRIPFVPIIDLASQL
jgi:hypothetical protein